MNFENLLLDRDGAIAVLTINRPQVLNALNTPTIEELRKAVAAEEISQGFFYGTGEWLEKTHPNVDMSHLLVVPDYGAFGEEVTRLLNSAFSEPTQTG